MKNTCFRGVALLALIASGWTSQANALSGNQPPPAGAILDLNGQPITNGHQSYSVDFNASVASTAITFAFRQDLGFVSFSNAQLIDITHPGGNLLANGGFASGTVGTSSVTDWTYANYGASFSPDGGVLATGCGVSGGNCWYDGLVEAYDAISQTIPTTVGDAYQISFNLDGGFGSYYSRVSTNGNIIYGNGIDVLAYAQAGLPVAASVPEPSTWTMLLLGFGGLGFAAYRKRKIAEALGAA